MDCDQVQAAATVPVNAANNQRLAGVAQDLSVAAGGTVSVF